MSEMSYENVIQSMKSNLVPKSVYGESKNEISRLKLELQNAKNELTKIKSEYEEQKMAIDIIQAEKESFAAEKKSLEAEKKTFEVKFKEVSLKLKQKSHQYDLMLKKAGGNPPKLVKSSTVTQTIKEEPHTTQPEIGIVNVPTSVSLQATQAAKTGSKRTHAIMSSSTPESSTDRNGQMPAQEDQAKRQKIQAKFTCEECFFDWGNDIESKSPRSSSDPRTIHIFETFEKYREHVLDHQALMPIAI